MTNEEAIEKYEKLTYDLAKLVSRMSDIYEQVKYVNSEMKWDGMFECDFETALAKLANVESAMITYSMEDKFKESDIKELELSLSFLKPEPKKK